MNKKIIIVIAVILGIAGVITFVSTRGNSSKAASPAQMINTREIKELHQKAIKLKQSNDLLGARAVYAELLEKYFDADNISSIQQEAEALNMQILFSRIEVPGKTVLHEVVPGDTLAKIARKYNTTIELIKRSNNMTSDVVRVGEKLRVWTGKFNIFVDKSENILMLKDGNDVIKVYVVATGENNSTPIGTFKITTKLENPVWFNKGIVVPPESPENVLGTRWLGFDLPGYGIHGTIEPKAIGMQVTAGCVRMINEQVEELYGIVPMGTEVVVVD